MFIRSSSAYKGNTLFFTIEDSDFTETIEMENLKHSGWEAIIRVYEQRNLNVAKNLMRAMVAPFYGNNNSSYTDIYLIINAINAINHKDMIEYNPSFHKYADEIKKYLLLI
jgi:hypothetical protein